MNLAIVSTLASSVSPAATLRGIAFEPEGFSTSTATMETRGIAHSSPFSYVEKPADGPPRTLWTNVWLYEVMDNSMVFLCHYHPDFYQPSIGRARLHRALAEREGGPLGVKRVREVVIGVRDLESAVRHW
jgi:hypothetical protein